MSSLRIAGRRVEFTRAGTGSAPTLVLLHGLGSSGASWESQFARLGNRLQLVAVDLPGQGASEPPATRDGYKVESQADLVAALLDALELERVHLAGHALGGVVALAFALSHADRLAGLILESVSPEALPESVRAQVRNSWSAESGTVPPRSDDEDAISRVLAPDVWRPGGTQGGGPAWALAAFDGYVERLETITVPTLVLAGESDAALLQRGAELLHGWMPFSRLVRIRNASHVPHEEAAETFAIEVGAFLHEVEAAG